jgi:hypothetical protein
MHAHDRRVNRDDPGQVAGWIGFGNQRGEDTFPGPLYDPVPQLV